MNPIESKVYKVIEHTADVGIEVKSSSISNAFNEVSLGFTEIITGGKLPDQSMIKHINVKSSNLDTLLIRYISKLIYLFDTENFLVGHSELKISKDSNYILSGRLFGEIYDEIKHGYGVEVKAVSYHMLKVQVGSPSKIKVILDL